MLPEDDSCKSSIAGSSVAKSIKIFHALCGEGQPKKHRIIATRRIRYMKHLPFVFLICIFLVTTLTGCDKAQQAIDAIDKAKTFSDDLQKKVKEVIPGSNQKAGFGKEGESGNKDKKDKKEKDD